MEGKITSVGETHRIVFGGDLEVTVNSTVVSNLNIRFGKKFLLSFDVSIMNTNFHSIINVGGDVVNSACPIKIEDEAWKCCRSTILNGTHIGLENIIAVGSVVIKKLENQYSICSCAGAAALKENAWIQ